MRRPKNDFDLIRPVPVSGSSPGTPESPRTDLRPVPHRNSSEDPDPLGVRRESGRPSPYPKAGGAECRVVGETLQTGDGGLGAGSCRDRLFIVQTSTSTDVPAPGGPKWILKRTCPVYPKGLTGRVGAPLEGTISVVSPGASGDVSLLSVPSPHPFFRTRPLGPSVKTSVLEEHFGLKEVWGRGM